MAAFTMHPSYDPNTFAIPHGAGPESADRKAPPPSSIYPNINDFARADAEQYYLPEHAAREWEKLWKRTWTCAGRVSDVLSAGQFIRYDLGKESFIIVRGHDHEIRAFYNVCQHRGRQLIDKLYGSRPQIACPFHSWAYDLAGKNKRVTDREVFTDRALCGDLDLKEVRCDVWAGFIFISMSPGGQTLQEFLGEIPDLMAAYRMEDMAILKDTMLEIDCNWKTGIEPFIESYHLHVTHPQALPGVDDVYEQFDAYPNGHGRIATPFAVPSPRTGDVKEIPAAILYYMNYSGVDPEKYDGGISEIRDHIWKVKRASDNRFGLDYSNFTNSQVLDAWNYFIFPNLTFTAHPEGVLMMRFLPHATNPEKFMYHVYVLGSKMKEGAEVPGYFGMSEGAPSDGLIRPQRDVTTMENPGLGEVLEQDISNMCAAQRGLKSEGFPGGMRFAEREGRVQVLHAELDLYLRGQK